MSAYFVTSTGTDIGKTFITQGLIRLLREKGKRVGALKPVASGFDFATASTSDPGILLAALAEPITPQSLDQISPFRFAAPLSPDMAAAREGRTIDFQALVAVCREAIARPHDVLFIEGVGGVMVPLDAKHTVLDWMKMLHLPLVLVAGSYLGTISHTLTALDVIDRARLEVAALVVNESSESTVPLDETIETLARFVVDVPIIVVPRVKHWSQARDAFERLFQRL